MIKPENLGVNTILFILYIIISVGTFIYDKISVLSWASFTMLIVIGEIPSFKKGLSKETKYIILGFMLIFWFLAMLFQSIKGD